MNMFNLRSCNKKSLWNLSLIGIYIALVYLPDITRYKNLVIILIGITALTYLVTDFRQVMHSMRNSLFLSILLFILAMFYSVAISVDPALSFQEMNKPILNGLLLFSFTFPVVLYKENKESIAKMILFSFAIGMLAICLTDIGRYIINYNRGEMPFTDYNHREFSYGFIFYFPILLCTWALWKKHTLVSWLILAVASAISLFLLLGTLTRGAWVAAVVITTFIITINREWKLIIVAGLSLSLLAGVSHLTMTDNANTKLLFKLTQTDSSYRYTNGTQGAAFELILENPIKGYGYGNKVYHKVYNERVADYPGWVFRTSIGPHNIFLALWFAGGIIGLITTLLMTISALYTGSHIITRNNGRIKQAGTILLTGFIGLFIVRGAFENTYINEIGILFGLMIALYKKKSD
ncbi:O-antigen ligase RfaL [Photorhabdus temperata]|uniref:Lipid A core-O-antigen ligase-like enyme n=2 Tax=Photorhabdus temperata TaxID=574560 RepID=A0A081RXE6_PHOTE|nr:O-antigen ligase RfaL [Photorhabdus temperata]KER03349.1 lipid A core-O-antigen ligase-like enyme [Photorhabdus temperata subsp. temperata Meg1]